MMWRENPLTLATARVLGTILGDVEYGETTEWWRKQTIIRATPFVAAVLIVSTLKIEGQRLWS
jgi:hypothetical protein